MPRSIDYGNLMHRAMRTLIRQVLDGVVAEGLPGAHHFFITFDTLHPDVEIADWLSDRYPEEMTVVIQHWFADLTVTDDGFSVTLNFGDNPEPLYIPFDAIRTFVDPSVEFGLRFETQSRDEEEGAPVAQLPAPSDAGGAEAPMAEDVPTEEAAKRPAEVVSLDSFRK